MNLYATKGAINARLTPLVDRLAAGGVSADFLSLAAIGAAATGAVALLVSAHAPAALLVIPPVVIVRLGLNLLDGQVARRANRVHPRGELYNEVGDRVADVLLLAPVALLPGADAVLVLCGVLVALLASYIGIAARAAGAERIYRGVLSKPGRMLLLAVCAVAVFVLGPAAWWPFGPLLLAGTTLTALERFAVAVRQLP